MGSQRLNSQEPGLFKFWVLPGPLCIYYDFQVCVLIGFLGMTIIIFAIINMVISIIFITAIILREIMFQQVQAVC